MERAIGVAGRAGANPFAAWRSGPYPMPPGAPMYGAVLSSAAAERVGLHPYEAPTAANSIAYDGRPACNNCGFCAFFGCPIHAKGDPVALLTKAMATGRAELMAETYVSRIVTSGRRATGVEYIGPDGVTHTMDAKLVIVAGGAIETPRLLLLSGLEHPALGPPPDGALPDDRRRALPGPAPPPAQGAVGDPRARRRHGAGRRARGRRPPRPGCPGSAAAWSSTAAAASRSWRPATRPGARATPRPCATRTCRERMWAFIMQGEDLPYATNTVDLSPSVRDARGFPVARVTYQPGHHELAASKHHGKILQSVLEEMGAEWVIHTSSPGVSYHGVGATPVPESRHVIGTARMGDDPDTSVVDRWGRVHALDNVVVADSSVFVTSSGYGPTLTLVALAARAAHHLAGTKPGAAARPLSAHAPGEQHGAGDGPAAVGHRRHLGDPAARPDDLALAALAAQLHAGLVDQRRTRAGARPRAGRPPCSAAAARRGRCWRRPR